MRNLTEDDRLDEAMRRGDDLLVGSLKREDRRRSRKRLKITFIVVAAACLVAGILWSRTRFEPRYLPGPAPLLSTKVPTAPPAPAAAAALTSQPNLAAKLLALTDDWRRALAVGYELTDADPDAALATLTANWSRIASFEARQQILKAFVFRTHPRVLDVLDLGMNDLNPQVRAWASNYLRNYAFVDFAENSAAYPEWRKRAAGKPLADVAADGARAYVDRLKRAAGPDLSREARSAKEARNGLRDVPAARDAALNAGLLDVATAWLREHPGDRDIVRGACDLLGAVKPDEPYLRSVILPLAVDDKAPLEVRSSAADLLGRPGNTWAVDPLLAALQRSLKTERSGAPHWQIAQALGEIGDPRAIPTMIGVIAADNTYDTVYGVGYFGLSKLTGVRYDESHDGAWWKTWWDRERQRFPEPARSATIPVLQKRVTNSNDPTTGSSNTPVSERSEDPDAFHSRAAPLLALANNPDDPPSELLTANDNDQMKFFRIGPLPPRGRDAKKVPTDGYHLLLVLPGGDGGDDFQPFVSNLLKQACPKNFIVAELIAPRWSDKDDRIVWPTEKSRDPKMKFTTEAFIDAVVATVAKTHKIDPRHVYALGWSSGGPAVYAAALRPKTPITGAFVAMSVYKPAQLPPVQNLKGRSFYILHSPQDFIPMTFPQNAEKQLRAAGAKTKLQTYEGGHGWQGDVFGNIRAGMDWLEQMSSAASPATTRAAFDARR